MSKTIPAQDSTTTAWWRLPIVWMVIGGPALVVVASFVTLGLAITHPDPVYGSADQADKSGQPALEARNHAASPNR